MKIATLIAAAVCACLAWYNVSEIDPGRYGSSSSLEYDIEYATKAIFWSLMAVCCMNGAKLE